jgi:hypothetical protein
MTPAFRGLTREMGRHARGANRTTNMESGLKEGNDRQFTPKVLLCRLIERTSANGNTYFTGYLGEARVILLADKNADRKGSMAASRDGSCF